MSELLHHYDAEYPGFLDYFQRLLMQYYQVGPRSHPLVAHRMEEALNRLGPQKTREALEQMTRAGLFGEENLSHDRQVQAFWSSPLMELFRAAVAYAPGPDDQLVASFPPPVQSLAEHAARQVAFRGTQLVDELGQVVRSYWRESLQVAAPELYLWPFLQGRDPLHGLDLGSGWGRGALGMRDYSRLRMTAVDIGADELELLRLQAAKVGLSERVQVCCADVTCLPFEANRFDFGLSYLLLDLLSDQALPQALSEVLRCLKPDAAFYVDMPTDYYNGAMQLQNRTAREFLEVMHGVKAHGKVFQLAMHDLRVARQYTFAVLTEDALEFPDNGRRPAWLVQAAAARLRGETPPPPPDRSGWRERLARVRSRRQS